jgi:uncharacterized protein (UPF0332 family)
VNLDLIETARMLATAGPGRPKQSNLKRAISTAYYALFHAFAHDAADLLVGGGVSRKRSSWRQVYRALEHGTAKSACAEAKHPPFAQRIVSCASAFVTLQQARHSADYDPGHRLTLADAKSRITLAEQAVQDLLLCSKPDRRDFAVHLLFKKRK